MAPDTRRFSAQVVGIVPNAVSGHAYFLADNNERFEGTKIGVSRVSGHGKSREHGWLHAACPGVSGPSGHARGTSVSGPLKGVRPDTRDGAPGQGGRSWAV